MQLWFLRAISGHMIYETLAKPIMNRLGLEIANSTEKSFKQKRAEVIGMIESLCEDGDETVIANYRAFRKKCEERVATKYGSENRLMRLLTEFYDAHSSNEEEKREAKKILRRVFMSGDEGIIDFLNALENDWWRQLPQDALQMASEVLGAIGGRINSLSSQFNWLKSAWSGMTSSGWLSKTPAWANNVFQKIADIGHEGRNVVAGAICFAFATAILIIIGGLAGSFWLVALGLLLWFIVMLVTTWFLKKFIVTAGIAAALFGDEGIGGFGRLCRKIASWMMWAGLSIAAFFLVFPVSNNWAYLPLILIGMTILGVMAARDRSGGSLWDDAMTIAAWGFILWGSWNIFLPESARVFAKKHLDLARYDAWFAGVIANDSPKTAPTPSPVKIITKRGALGDTRTAVLMMEIGCGDGWSSILQDAYDAGYRVVELRIKGDGACFTPVIIRPIKAGGGPSDRYSTTLFAPVWVQDYFFDKKAEDPPDPPFLDTPTAVNMPRSLVSGRRFKKPESSPDPIVRIYL